MKIVNIIVILFLFGAKGTINAQHIAPATGRLQQYTDALQGQQIFTRQPLAGDIAVQVKDFISQNLLQNYGGNAAPEPEMEKQAPEGTYYSYTFYYNNVPVYGRSIKAFVDKTNTLRWLYHNLPAAATPQQTVFYTQAQAADFFQSKFARGFLLATSNVWMEDNSALLPAFYLTVKDTVNYKVEQHVFGTDGIWLYTLPLYSRAAAVDTPGYGYVYDPDPLTTANVFYGGAYAHNSGQDNAQLQAQRKKRTMPVTLLGDSLILYNTQFYVAEVTAPSWPATRVYKTDTFKYSRSHYSFGEVNAFYHLNNYTEYVHGLGYTLPGFTIQVDAHAFNGAENSQFTAGDIPPSLQFGDGGVPDAEDAEVVIHELGHALAWGASPNSTFGQQRQAIDEGLGDYFAVSYSKSIDTFNWPKVFTWDGNNGGWQGRTVNYAGKYPNLTNSKWTDGQLWSTGFMLIYEQVGRQTADRLMLGTLYRLANNITMPQLADAVLQVDTLQNGGNNSLAIRCAFATVGILQKPANGCTIGIPETPQKLSLCSVYNTLGFAMGSGDAELLFDTDGEYLLCLTDINGKQLWVQTAANGRNNSISGYSLQAGVYFLHITGKGGVRQSVKLVRY